MALLWLLLRVRWRRAFAQSLAVALLIGAVGGFVLASAAAARRVDGAYRTLINEIDAPDIAVIPIVACGDAFGLGCEQEATDLTSDEVIADLSTIEVVERVRLVEAVFPFFVDAEGAPLLGTPDDEFGCYDGDRSVQVAAIVPGGPHDQQMPFRLEGALPEPGGVGIVLTRATSQRTGLGIGDSMRLAGWCPGDGDPVEFDAPVDLIVTGLSVGPLDVEPPGTGLAIEPAFVDRSIFELMVLDGAQPGQNITVWLDPAATPDEIGATLTNYQILIDFRERAAVFDEALANDADLLWLLAGIGALAGLLVLAPLLGRNLRDTGPSTTTLAALGTCRPQVAQHGVMYTGSLALVGAAVAVVVAIPLSTRLPRGLADAIDPHQQLWFDGAATLIGVVLLIVVIVAIGAISVWWIGRNDRSPVGLSERGGGVGKVLRLRPASRSGVSASVGSPVGPRRASPWPSLISMMLAVTTGVASLTYLAGLRHLEATPRLLGWNWDAVVSFDFIEGEEDRIPAVLAAIGEHPAVEQMTPGTSYPPAFLFVPGGESFIWPWAFATGPGAITPTIASGRAPQGPDEVAIDALFAEQSGLDIGDQVTLARATLVATVAEELTDALEDFGMGDILPPVPNQEPVAATLEITGIALLPLERSQAIPQVALTLDGLAALVEPTAEEVAFVREWLPTDLPPEIAEGVESGLANLDIEDRTVYLRFTGDKSAAAEAIANIDGVPEIVAPTPAQVVSIIVGLNLDRNDRVPAALVIMMAIAFGALIVYLMSFAVRGRRFEFAVMRALGLSTRDVRWSIAAQATATAVVALLIATPVGALVGRWAWVEYAHDLGVVPVAVLPWSTLALVGVAAIVGANAAALLPGWFAARRSPGADLRSE